MTREQKLDNIEQAMKKLRNGDITFDEISDNALGLGSGTNDIEVPDLPEAPANSHCRGG